MARWALLAVAVSAVACRSEPAFDRVVFITVDTLRADHLGSFGYPIETSPFLDRLASEGVSFKRAYAHSATTGPSHASMFTGLYPIQHRVRNNGQILDGGFVTLAESLEEAGFRTAAFVSGMSHFGKSLIAQGFGHYDQPVKRAFQEGRKPKLYRSADRTVDAVVKWLRRADADVPMFLWVHFYDPHKPYRLPAKRVRAVTPATADARQAFRRFLISRHRASAGPTALKKIHRYDAEIRLVDAQIERLVSAFADRGLAERTLWVITSDHGQGLSNHGWFGHHSRIYNVQLHVPLIFWTPTAGVLVPGAVSDTVVEQVDIPPTLLDLLNGEMRDQAAPVQGRSLVPRLRGASAAPHKSYAFAERRIAVEGHPVREPGERFALQDLGHKLIWFSEGPGEFYDLVEDPYETTNLIGDPRGLELAAVLREQYLPLATEGTAELVDAETLEQLRSLGYVD